MASNANAKPVNVNGKGIHTHCGNRTRAERQATVPNPHINHALLLPLFLFISI